MESVVGPSPPGAEASVSLDRGLPENEADFGGGILFAGNSAGNIDTSTFDRSVGGAIVSRSFNSIEIDRSTFRTIRMGLSFEDSKGQTEPLAHDHPCPLMDN